MTELAQKPPSPIVVQAVRIEDTSEFSNLLDSAKFSHLQRVAALFAASTMVPSHFQNKPEDCFIACQMAIRLGVDPFMFLQNTYIIGGKPGMEAKLAIALINTSGLFAGPLDYELTGEGDDRGCRATAVLKRTGEITEGPRVTIGIAKAEGWFGRNGSKWKTIPDLMLQYRAAAWFGRLKCPERLMGMQTVDEIKDTDGAMPIIESGLPTPAQGRTAALADRIKAKQPTPAIPAENTPASRERASENAAADSGADKQESGASDSPAVPSVAANTPSTVADAGDAPAEPSDAYPVNCTLDQLAAMIKRHLPEGVEFPGAWSRLLHHIATKSAKPWPRMTSDSKKKLWDSIVGGEFVWTE